MDRELGLRVMCARSAEKQAPVVCFSHSVDLAACPERAAHGMCRWASYATSTRRGVSGSQRPPRRVLVAAGAVRAARVERPVFGSSESITVGGVPVGEEDFEMEWMARRGATVAGYITST